MLRSAYEYVVWAVEMMYHFGLHCHTHMRKMVLA